LHSILPWAGYGIYNRYVVPATLVLTPVGSPNNITRKIVAQPDGWKLNIGAYGDTYIDPGNAVGRLSGSLEGLDFRDNPEPPYMGGYVSVVMPRKEWNANISHFTSDIRSLAEPDGVWDVELRVKKETSPVTLSMDMEGDFPIEHDIVLLDLINRDTHHIKENSSVTLNQNWGKFPVYPFKVIAGSPEYVSSMTQEILSQLPETFTLHQNYPNPFNPTTTNDVFHYLQFMDLSDDLRERVDFIECPSPGSNYVGVEVPDEETLRDLENEINKDGEIIKFNLIEDWDELD